jgi:hypothetical protein
MGARSIKHDTIPCPPPEECGAESGEYAAVPGRVRRTASSHPAPRYAHILELELQQLLATIRCPVHGDEATAAFSIADDGGVEVVPLGCCDQLDRLVLATLRESVTLAPPRVPDFDTSS